MPRLRLIFGSGHYILHMRQMHAAYRKESTVEQGEIRRPVNPRLHFQKRILPTEPDMDHLLRQSMYFKAHEKLRTARKPQNGDCKTILQTWYRYEQYRKSLSGTGWTEEHIKQYDALALEDHSHVCTLEEGSRYKNSWNISLNREGIQGPINQRSDFIEPKQK